MTVPRRARGTKHSVVAVAGAGLLALASALLPSQSGLDSIKKHEGVRYTAYLDAVQVPTICYGSTRKVYIGQRATPAECEERLLEDATYAGKGVAKGVTMAGFASGAGMGVWGCIDLYKASKSQSGQSGNYAPGVAKVVIGALALGIGEFLGSGSATLFGSDQTTGLDELGLR